MGDTETGTKSDISEQVSLGIRMDHCLKYMPKNLFCNNVGQYETFEAREKGVAKGDSAVKVL